MELASRGRRLLAQAIDTGPVLALVVSILLGSDRLPRTFLALLVLTFLALLLVQLGLLWRRGQTLGKIALGIRIVMTETRVNGGFVPNVLLRTLINGALTAIPFYGLIDILFIFRKDRRCLHDLLAGTSVAAGQPGSESAAPQA